MPRRRVHSGRAFHRRSAVARCGPAPPLSEWLAVCDLAMPPLQQPTTPARSTVPLLALSCRSSDESRATRSTDASQDAPGRECTCRPARLESRIGVLAYPSGGVWLQSQGPSRRTHPCVHAQAHTRQQDQRRRLAFRSSFPGSLLGVPTRGPTRWSLGTRQFAVPMPRVGEGHGTSEMSQRS